MINGLIQAFGGEMVFLAWHFLWGIWSILCYLLVNWVYDSRILIKIWNFIKHIIETVVVAILTYKSKKNGRK